MHGTVAEPAPSLALEQLVQTSDLHDCSPGCYAKIHAVYRDVYADS